MEPRYSSKQMQNIWSIENKYQVWLRVEFAAYTVMAEKGVVPNEIEYVSNKLKFLRSKINTDRIQEIESITNHDVVAFIQYLEEETDNATRFFHYGMTSSDVVDTSLSIVLSNALNLVRVQLLEAIKILRERVEESLGVIMVGRTHGMHAQPTTLSNFFAGHLSEFKRCLEGLDGAIRTVSCGKLSGPVGAYLNITPEIERAVMEKLDLKVEPASTQVIPRDRHMDAIYALVKCAVACERLATNIRHLHRTEIGDIKEGFAQGQKGSSSMPHKKNPITCEKICGLSRTIRSFLSPAIEDVVLWHERDISHSSVERIIMPQSTAYTEHVLQSMIKVLSGLVIDRVTMHSRFRQDNSWVSESVMLKLIQKGHSRTEAHTIVQEMLNGKHNIRRYLESKGLMTEEESYECVNYENLKAHEMVVYNRVTGA